MSSTVSAAIALYVCDQVLNCIQLYHVIVGCGAPVSVVCLACGLYCHLLIHSHQNIPRYFAYLQYFFFIGYLAVKAAWICISVRRMRTFSFVLWWSMSVAKMTLMGVVKLHLFNTTHTIQHTSQLMHQCSNQRLFHNIVIYTKKEFQKSKFRNKAYSGIRNTGLLM